ncbi:hypothetical protein HY212_06130 [Candidatus Pacearchaeota archaeon]|nr:hypothetical protein [Candidatus Pacearchaeota archaeon]
MELQNPEVREEYEKFQKLKESDPQGKDWVAWFNNLSLKVPGGAMPNYYYGPGIRDLDKRHDECEHAEYYKKMSSALRFSQTNRQFYQNIERVLREDGILEDVQKELTPSPITTVNFRRLYSLLIPSYFKLRDMGYNRFDLT